MIEDASKRGNSGGRIAVGLVVNPIAGMGGAVGLKGTDGPEILARGIARGATPMASARARRTLKAIAAAGARLRIETPAAPLGQQTMEGLGLDVRVLGNATDRPTTAADTRAAVQRMRARGVDLILFAGGDGTARDVAEEIELAIPILGIPCGVKMHSGVFATSPEAAGRLIVELSDVPGRLRCREAEIMDVDEDAARENRITTQLYGYARVPCAPRLVQAAKGGLPLAGEAAVNAACAAIAAEMAPGTLYLIGPGRTAKRVLEELGLDGTLLGVDAVLDRRLVGRDLSQSEILELMRRKRTLIIVGVIGGQGFVLGRGNQQIGPRVIRQVGRGGLIIVASADKLLALPEPRLLVDTGDPVLDAALAGHVRVRIGARQTMLMRLET
jgi:predicted polyphosphate/ATP-dependent NAD kinase